MFLCKKDGLPGMIIGSIILMPVLLPAIGVMAQDKCAQQLAEADQQYYAGRFDEAIELATTCINSGGTTEAYKLRGYRLVSLAYIGKDYLEQAKAAVRKLLELVPAYEPDPDQDPPPFTNLVREIKQALQQEKKQQERMTSEEPEAQMPQIKKGGKKTWLFIGGGTVAAGVLVYLATRPPPPEKIQLPLPPDPPSQ